jgi:hypothetical protein
MLLEKLKNKYKYDIAVAKQFHGFSGLSEEDQLKVLAIYDFGQKMTIAIDDFFECTGGDEMDMAALYTSLAHTMAQIEKMSKNSTKLKEIAKTYIEEILNGQQ